MKDVGILQVKVLKAADLLAADFSGKEHRASLSLLFLLLVLLQIELQAKQDI